MSRVWLIRGLPGSGKSTVAQAIANQKDADWYEADMYFEEFFKGEFHPSELSNAHEWCKVRFRESLDNYRDVVISNTFTRSWEIMPYLEECMRRKIKPQIIECHGDFGSVHEVPEATIQKMRERWDRTSLILKGLNFG